MKSLVARFPETARLPRVAIADLPTPVLDAPRLSEEVGATIAIKRDDLTAPAPGRYGGNKVRKLEPVLGAALARGARTIVTIGAVGSHHVLATGVYAREAGLAVDAVLFEQPMTDHVRGNLRGILAAGVRPVLAGSLSRALSAMAVLAARAAARDRAWPVVLGPGGSTPLGTVGYVDAGLELSAQIRAGAVAEPEHVFVALGSGGTVAGILAGLRLGGIGARVHAVVVAEAALLGAPVVRALAAAALRRLRALDPSLPRCRLDGLEIERGDLGAGYGTATPACLEAIDLAWRTEGLVLEPTYTGKTLAALIRAARGRLGGRRLLYWHTLSAATAADLGLGAAAVVPPSLRHLI